MALPEGVTTATVTAGVPVTHSGAPVKSFVSIEPSAYLVHAATGTPLVDFLEEISVSEGVAAQFTLPHTDQAGFIDENGNAYTNWYYTARITYSTASKAKSKSPKVKVFQLATGQTEVDLDTLPGGAPALPYSAPVATVTSFGGRTGAIELDEADLPERLTDTALSATYGPDATPMQNKFSLKRAFYPESYGADPTGVNNSTPGIQGAIDAASAAGGGVVVIGGTYRVDTSITPKDNVILQGLGWGVSQLVPTAAWANGASIIQLGGSTANPCENFFVRDIKFDMSAVLSTRQGKALFVTYMRNLRFENNWVLNSTATGIGADFLDASVIRGNRVEGCGRYAAGNEETYLGCSGIGIGTGAWGSEATLVEGNFVINPQRYGIFTEYQSGISSFWTFGVKILNNYITGAYRGIGTDGVAYDHIVGNHVEGSRQDGIVIAPGNAGAASYGTIVSQNTVRTSTRYGMLIDFSWGGNGSPPESGKFKVTDNQLVFNTGVGLKVVMSSQMKGFQICNNRISENGSIGVDITGGGLLESDIIDNRITDNTGVGIRILGNCLRVRIRGNRSGDTRASGRTQVSGVQLSSVITDSIIEGNDFRNTTGAAIDQPSAPVNSVIRNNHGYNPQGTDSLTVTASPMTYNVGPAPENLYVIGGTWTNVSLNGVNMATTNPSVIMAQPNDVVVFTYTAAPTAIKRHRL